MFCLQVGDQLNRNRKSGTSSVQKNGELAIEKYLDMVQTISLNWVTSNFISYMVQQIKKNGPLNYTKPPI